ncbi:hypothetical protein B9Z55_027229 [Caenorhabditis nigoni]|uniref:Uncharacterized protein n=1 Tax=Caenorhabditis nigoni TaxID=1611254 RepID=A0A2G5SH49_9PELO|nr:hypothetical protein B9Z55_027229 [Caenorhabditis nigoni]
MSPTPLVVPIKSSTSFFTAKQCLRKRINILGVHRGNSLYAFYEYSSGKFHWHKCQCQIQITESHLTPHYAVYSERKKDHVIFVYNNVTDKIEQYSFNETTGGLEQVDCSELIYDSNLMVREGTVATLQNGRILLQDGSNGGIRKLSQSFGQWVEIPRIAVKTLRDPPQDNQSTTTYPTNEIGPFTYFRIDNCTHNRFHVTIDGSPYYTYQYYNGDFFSCQPCSTCPDPNILMDSQLIPRYSVFSKQHKTLVIFAKSAFTSWVGKFIYTNQGFKEVFYSDVVYDPSVILQSQTLCVLDEGTVVVYQNRNGSLSVDRWDEVERQFRTVPPKKVRIMERGIVEYSKDSKGSKSSEDPEAGEDPKKSEDSDASENSKDSSDSEDAEDSGDSKNEEDSEDFEDSKDPVDTEDSEDPKEYKDPKDYKASEASTDSKDSNDPANTEDSEDPKGCKDSDGSQDSEESKDPVGFEDPKDSKASEASTDSRYSKDSGDSEDSNDLKDFKNSDGSEDSKNSGDSKDPKYFHAVECPKEHEYEEASKDSKDSEASDDAESSGKDSEDSDDSDMSILDPMEVEI